MTVNEMNRKEFFAALASLGATHAEREWLWEILDDEGFGGREYEGDAAEVLANRLDWFRTVRNEDGK